MSINKPKSETKKEAFPSSSGEKDQSKDKNSGSQFITKNELESFGSNLITQMKDLFKKETDVHRDNLGKSQSISSSELGMDRRGIDPVSEHHFADQAELEAFMNDFVEIYVHPSPNKEDNPIIVPNVNGVNQPIIRGRVCKVKRKYIEALARNRNTRYEQQVPDPSKPHQFKMRPDVVVKDPFTVRHDPNPIGHEWLQAILNER